MQLQKAIKKRRSIRSYKNKKPDWRDIIDCIDSTRYSPYAGGYYSLKFLILDNEKDIQLIAELSDQDFIKEAPYVVIFVSDTSITKHVYPERGETYSKQQAGAAIQNFLLSAVEKGLSSCWIGHFNKEKITKEFKIKGDIEAILPIGYAKEEPKRKEIEPSLFNRTFFHEFGNKRMERPRAIHPFDPKPWGGKL